ncbi:DUF1194 domain-containing protein [Stappia sp.]|uniref:DUF1194 domain-containing protein n=1 Tax=Stappia sp. TaxID=1870903 RepID=UPI003A9A236F
MTHAGRHLAATAAALLAFTLAALAPRTTAAEMAVDLELVLAVDASASVDETEFSLQMNGIAAAFRSREVQEAIASGPAGRIAVALAVWAEAERPADLTPFHLVRDGASASYFASAVEAWPRRVNGGTGIGAGLAHAMRHFDRNGYAGRRRVVDVSGDGRETPPRDYVVLIETARGMALGRGIIINGLAIENEDRGLAQWYRDNVAVGPRSFVMSVARYEDFAAAMRRKLIREIEDRPPLAAVAPGATASER